MDEKPLPAYHRTPFARELETPVLGRGEQGGRPWILTQDTVVYPGGGGQPADLGEVDGREITAVAWTPEGVRHELGAPVALAEPHARGARDVGSGAGGGPASASGTLARISIDWRRRFDHMQQHTAQHLLSAIAQDRYGWATTAFHLGADRSDIELDVAALSEAQLEQLEEDVMQAVREAAPVTSRVVGVDEYKSLPVRTRGLPEGHTGDVRLVEIRGYDLASCGGTHLASTAQIESMKLLGTESMRGGTRLHWVAGGRVRSRLGAHELRADSMRRLLGAGDDALLATLEGKVEQVKSSDRRVRWLEDRLAASEAARILSRLDARQDSTPADARPAPTILDAHFDGFDAGFLKAVSQHLQGTPGSWTALLTAETEGSAAFVIVRGATAPGDLKRMGAAVAALLDGRGGGAGQVFQGKAGSLARRGDAVSAIVDESGS